VRRFCSWSGRDQDCLLFCFPLPSSSVRFFIAGGIRSYLPKVKRFKPPMPVVTVEQQSGIYLKMQTLIATRVGAPHIRHGTPALAGPVPGDDARNVTLGVEHYEVPQTQSTEQAIDLQWGFEGGSEFGH
jgi:hypothetical protein